VFATDDAKVGEGGGKFAWHNFALGDPVEALGKLVAVECVLSVAPCLNRISSNLPQIFFRLLSLRG